VLYTNAQSINSKLCKLKGSGSESGHNPAYRGLAQWRSTECFAYLRKL
jgi:hypothetical protein